MGQSTVVIIDRYVVLYKSGLYNRFYCMYGTKSIKVYVPFKKYGCRVGHKLYGLWRTNG